MSDYTEKAWYKLDNAAKIFPPTSSESDTKVFRLSCELYEEVNEAFLQSALERTIESFPSFRCVLKRGMFWYYLEQSDIHPIVRKEETPPCSKIYLQRRSLLFDVTWYGKRINFEAYHSLTDGTGALQFLRVLVLHYLKIAYPDTMKEATEIDFLEGSDTQKTKDSFDKYYNRDKSKDKSKNVSAYRIKGAREAEYRLNIIEGSVSVKELLNKSREYDTTATVLVIALFILAIHGEMNVRDRKKPVVIAVPVNLRNFFDSKSTRNFFGLINVQYDFQNNEATLEAIIAMVKKCLDENLNQEYLQIRLNKLIKFERNFLIRIVPLSIKNIVMNFATFLAERGVTAAVSNVGKITMPDEAKSYIRLFDVFTSTKRVQLCICSYQDSMTISITSPFVSKDIQCNFFRQLTDMGLAVEISANDLKGTREVKVTKGNSKK